MIVSPLNTYIASVRSDTASTPVMMDESSIFVLLSGITGQHLLSYIELAEANITNISIYDIPEDKKEFNIETVRRCIVDIELRPYEWKHIYILRHFSTATGHAQNALLKILEECPSYAVIVLEVENPNSVLETIKSRVINLAGNQKWDPINPVQQEIVEFYKKKEYKKLAQALYSMKCTSDEALTILQWVYPYLSQAEMIRCDLAIESLVSTHENPRSILDVFFI
jgi:hypothetical protein